MKAVAYEEEIVELFGTLRNPLLRYVLTFGIAAHEDEEVAQEAVLRGLPEQDRYCVCLRAEGLRYR